MNQKGFTTIFALCMILVIALVVKGIQESEMNHAYETMDFQDEFELQNAADSGIYEAAEAVRLNEDILPTKIAYFNRKNFQVPVITATKESKRFDRIEITVFGERGVKQSVTSGWNIHHRQTKYLNNGKTSYTDKGYSDGYILLSVAEGKIKNSDKKIYRRAFAYILDSDATKIHFMETD